MPSYTRRLRIAELERQLQGARPKQLVKGTVVDDLSREPLHIRFGRNNMAVHANPRAKTVQKVLEEDISGLSAYSASHLEVPLQFELVRSPNVIEDGDMKVLLGLVEMTSGHDYRASSIGWDPRKKREEMMDKDMMYLLVRQGDYPANEDNDSAELDESSDEPSSIESSSEDGDDDEDIEMAEAEDTHTEGQEAIAEEKSDGREEEKDTHAAIDGAPQPNALEQLLQDYASDSNEEGGAMLDNTTESHQSAPPLTGGVTWEHAINTASIEARARAERSIPTPRSPEHAWKTRRIPGPRQVQPAPRAPPNPSSASDSDDEEADEEADEESDEEADEPDTIVPASPPPTAANPNALTPEEQAAPSAYNNRILGFMSFMFTYDDPPHDDREVLYIYEIHLHARLRGQGLGSNLIGFVEDVARECGVDKTMLTVFTANKGARRVYERKGYEMDECSPKDRVMRRKTVEAEYVIMSKLLQ
jgi:GNAT superfamily N-acetyltransferase